MDAFQIFLMELLGYRPGNAGPDIVPYAELQVMMGEKYGELELISEVSDANTEEKFSDSHTTIFYLYKTKGNDILFVARVGDYAASALLLAMPTPEQKQKLAVQLTKAFEKFYAELPDGGQ